MKDKRNTCHYFTIEHKNLLTLDCDHDENSNTMATELEVAEENEEEEIMEIETNMSDEVTLERLRKIPSPRVTKSRIGTKSLCMDQMILLEKNDIKRLKENQKGYQDCYAHQCVHFKKLLTFP